VATFREQAHDTVLVNLGLGVGFTKWWIIVFSNEWFCIPSAFNYVGQLLSEGFRYAVPACSLMYWCSFRCRSLTILSISGVFLIYLLAGNW
jgi:hypothetical protein